MAHARFVMAVLLASAVLGGSSLLLLGQPQLGGTVVEAITDPTTLSVFNGGTRFPEARTLNLIHETLIIVNERLEYEGLLAESWESSDDARTWTIRLRRGINFHDGTPFNAEAVKFNLEKHLEGVHAWRLGTLQEVVVVDDYTVQLHFKDPYPLLPFFLCENIWMVSPTAVKEAGEDYGSIGIVGTGPFKFEKWVSGQEIDLVRNEEYNHGPSFVSNKGPAYPERWILRIIPEDSTRIWELEEGNVDLTQFIIGTQLPELEACPTVSVETRPSGTLVHVAINTSKPPFDDVRVREAANHAINRENVIKAAMGGVGTPAYMYSVPGSIAYWKEGEELAYQKTFYSPEKAEHLLSEAGWIDVDGNGIREKDGQKLSIEFFTFPFARPRGVAVACAEMLRQVGFDSHIRVLEAADLYQRVSKGEHNLMSTAEGGIKNIMRWYRQVFHSDARGTKLGWFVYSDPEMDAILNKYFTSVDPEERLQAAYAAQKKVTEEVLAIPIAYPLDIVAYKTKRVGGIDKWLEHPWALQEFRLPLALEIYVKH